MGEQQQPKEAPKPRPGAARLPIEELADAAESAVRRAIVARKPKPREVKIVARRAILWDRLCALSEYIGPLAPGDGSRDVARALLPQQSAGDNAETISLLGTPGSRAADAPPQRPLDQVIEMVLGPDPVRFMGTELGVVFQPGEEGETPPPEKGG